MAQPYCQLQHLGRDLTVPFPAYGPIPDYRGIIAAPWPNRIRDGKYEFQGVEYQIPTNEPERACALHGFAFDLDWTVEEQDDSSVWLMCFIRATPGYPFTLCLSARYRLDNHGLHTSITATNIGGKTAPYGVCPHPYLVAGPAPMDEWTLRFPAKSFLEVTPDRLLPLAVNSVDHHNFDFRQARKIGAIKIDHAFTDISFTEKDRARLIALDPGGTGVGMEWDRKCQWLQIHTADKPWPLPNRLGLAVEPMTCPPNAFNSKQNLLQLEPGLSHEVSWSIFSPPMPSR